MTDLLPLLKRLSDGEITAEKFAESLCSCACPPNQCWLDPNARLATGQSINDVLKEARIDPMSLLDPLSRKSVMHGLVCAKRNFQTVRRGLITILQDAIDRKCRSLDEFWMRFKNALRVADIHARDEKENRTALHILCEYPDLAFETDPSPDDEDGKRLDPIEMLLAAGASLTDIDAHGRTALLCAASVGLEQSLGDMVRQEPDRHNSRSDSRSKTSKHQKHIKNIKNSKSRTGQSGDGPERRMPRMARGRSTSRKVVAHHHMMVRSWLRLTGDLVWRGPCPTISAMSATAAADVAMSSVLGHQEAMAEHVRRHATVWSSCASPPTLYGWTVRDFIADAEQGHAFQERYRVLLSPLLAILVPDLPLDFWRRVVGYLDYCQPWAEKLAANRSLDPKTLLQTSATNNHNNNNSYPAYPGLECSLVRLGAQLPLPELVRANEHVAEYADAVLRDWTRLLQQPLPTTPASASRKKPDASSGDDNLTRLLQHILTGVVDSSLVPFLVDMLAHDHLLADGPLVSQTAAAATEAVVERSIWIVITMWSIGTRSFIRWTVDHGLLHEVQCMLYRRVQRMLRSGPGPVGKLSCDEMERITQLVWALTNVVSEDPSPDSHHTRASVLHALAFLVAPADRSSSAPPLHDSQKDSSSISDSLAELSKDTGSISDRLAELSDRVSAYLQKSGETKLSAELTAITTNAKTQIHTAVGTDKTTTKPSKAKGKTPPVGTEPAHGTSVERNGRTLVIRKRTGGGVVQLEVKTDAGGSTGRPGKHAPDRVRQTELKLDLTLDPPKETKGTKGTKAIGGRADAVGALGSIGRGKPGSVRVTFLPCFRHWQLKHDKGEWGTAEQEVVECIMRVAWAFLTLVPPQTKPPSSSSEALTLPALEPWFGIVANMLQVPSGSIQHAYLVALNRIVNRLTDAMELPASSLSELAAREVANDIARRNLAPDGLLMRRVADVLDLAVNVIWADRKNLQRITAELPPSSSLCGPDSDGEDSMTVTGPCLNCRCGKCRLGGDEEDGLCLKEAVRLHQKVLRQVVILCRTLAAGTALATNAVVFTPRLLDLLIYHAQSVYDATHSESKKDRDRLRPVTVHDRERLSDIVLTLSNVFCGTEDQVVQALCLSAKPTNFLLHLIENPDEADAIRLDAAFAIANAFSFAPLDHKRTLWESGVVGKMYELAADADMPVLVAARLLDGLLEVRQVTECVPSLAREFGSQLRQFDYPGLFAVLRRSLAAAKAARETLSDKDEKRVLDLLDREQSWL